MRSLAHAFLLVTGSAVVQPDGEVSRLRQFGQISIPNVDRVDRTVTGLVEAAERLAASEDSAADRAMTLVSLLTSALKHYEVHGPGVCPVCGYAGALNEQWRAQAEAEVARLETEAAEAVQARTLASAAKTEAVSLFKETPAVLTDDDSVGAADPAPTRDASAAWRQHPDEEGPAGLRALTEHITQTWPVFSAAVNTLVGAADGELRVREDRWALVPSPLADESVEKPPRRPESG